MARVTADTITMNYDRQGTGEPLILIPYLGADHACYAFQVAEYAKHFTCISVDLRGNWRESDAPQNAYSTEVLADDVAAFMRAMGIATASRRRPLLVAQSACGWRRNIRTRSLRCRCTAGGRRAMAFLQAVVDSWQIVAKCVGVPGDDDLRFHLPVVLHAGDVCREAELRRVLLAAFVRSRPAQSLPDFVLQSNAVLAPRRGGTPRPDCRADLPHLRTSRPTDLDAIRGAAQRRHPPCRNLHLRRLRARTAIRERRGVQSEDAGVPAASARNSLTLAHLDSSAEPSHRTDQRVVEAGCAAPVRGTAAGLVRQTAVSPTRS